MIPFKVFKAFKPFKRIANQSLASIIRSMYANGEQGLWYDPSDLSTLYQDAAGTTPVTAMEQFVGLMLDKSGNGNHAFQATLTKRMKVSRRVNLLTKTEDFADAAWTRAGVSLNAAGASPNGNQATKLIAENGTQVSSVRTTAVQSCVGVKILAKFGGTRYLSVAFNQYDTYAATFDLVDGLVTQQPTAYSGETADIVSVGDGWYECTRKFASGGLKNLFPQFVLSRSPTGNSANTTIEGNGVDGVFVAEPSVCRTVEGVGLPYQRVNTATDYDDDPAKFPTYLKPDGIDDGYVTNDIDLTGTDKVNVWVGITKLSDAVGSPIMEFGSDSNTLAGSFMLSAPISAGSASFGFRSRGTATATTTATGLAAPLSTVAAGIGDISGDIATLILNGTQAAQSTADQGTGNYGKYPLFIGARNQTSLFFNGEIYSLIVRGALSNASQQTAVNQYIKQKMMLP